MKKNFLIIMVCITTAIRADKVLTPVNTLLNVFVNESHIADYKVFVGSGDSRFLLIRNTNFDLEKTHPQLSESIRVSDRARIDVLSVTDNAKSMYIKFGGYASGHTGPEVDGPFYIEMWMEYPDAPEINRTYVRYTQTGQVGRLGLRISEAGEPDIFAVENTIIIH